MCVAKCLSTSALAMLASACASLNPRPFVVSGAEVDARSNAVEAAGVDFRQAWSERDSAGLSRTTSPNLTLVVEGDSLEGEEARKRLLSLAVSERMTLSLRPGKLENCREGGTLETNGEAFGLAPENAVRSGRYAVTWTGTSAAARAERIDLRYGAGSIRESATCTPESKHASLRHRLSVSAIVGQRDASTAATSSVTALIHNRGYAFRTGTPGYGPAPGHAAFPHVAERGDVTGLGLRYLLTESAALELQVQTHSGMRVEGFGTGACGRPPCDDTYYFLRRYVEVKSAPVSAAMLGSYRHGRLRFGAGPAIMLANWKVHDDERYLTQSLNAKFLAWDPVYRFDPHDSRSTGAALGAQGDVAYLIPLSRSVVFEARASALLTGKSRVPSTPLLQGTSISHQFVGLGGALSFGWR
jgi:hypothetical protein